MPGRESELNRVEWKAVGYGNTICPAGGISHRRLRENHSGMETNVFSYYFCLLILLRENHSGMET